MRGSHFASEASLLARSLTERLVLGRLLSGDVRLDTIGQCLCPSDWGCTATMGMPRDLVSSSVKQADIHLFLLLQWLGKPGRWSSRKFFLVDHQTL